MKVLIWACICIALLLVVLAVGMRLIGSDPEAWHVDPLTAQRSESPNDYFLAPLGMTVAIPDGAAPVKAIAPRDYLFLFDAVARNAPRIEVLAGSVDDLIVTYVQRTAVFGFPDYITVKAVPQPEGSTLVIWSRARLGYSDMGVNEGRIRDWLSKIEEPPE